MERMTETVVLSDGRKVTMQELTGMDQMAAKKVLKAKSASDALTLPEVLVCFAVADVDGTKHNRPSNIVGVQSFFSSVKLKDYSKMDKAYKRLNEDDELGEIPAVDTE